MVKRVYFFKFFFYAFSSKVENEIYYLFFFFLYCLVEFEMPVGLEKTGFKSDKKSRSG
jgi:hypothetical protein